MVEWDVVTFVFIAGLITALATGIGALPFFFVEKVSDQFNVVLWGVAAGIMLAASVFGLIPEGLNAGSWVLVAIGGGADVVLVVGAKRLLTDANIDPKTYKDADFKKLVLTLGVLTVHSFPERIAIGVSRRRSIPVLLSMAMGIKRL